MAREFSKAPQGTQGIGDWQIRELLSSTRGSAVQEAVSDVGASHTHVPRGEDEYHPTSAVGHAFGVSDEAGMEAPMAEMQANHTGNHYRNHSVQGPYCAG